MLSIVASCPPCKLAVDVKQPAGFPINAPDCHMPLVPSKKYLRAAAMLPKRVGLPSAHPAQPLRSSCVAYGGPSDGMAGSAVCVFGGTAGGVFPRASVPAKGFQPFANS